MAHLKIEKITKTFGAFTALDGIDLSIPAGCIQAILGENGAGKTTLMNVLYGLYRPDAGRIILDDEELVMSSPKQAIDHGIGMIHQHFHLANALSVTENIVIGLRGRGSLRLEEHEERLEALSRSFGFDIDPRQPIWKLPMGMRQRVEILKALYRDARVLVLDEPTSVLAPDEIGNFLDGLRRLREDGRTILFITHKMDEVMAVSDRVAVMRHGKVVAERDTSVTNPRELSSLMIGRESEIQLDRREGRSGEVALEINAASALGDRGVPALKELSLSVRSGEVLGITGVDGNGQKELAEVITGLRQLTGGSVHAFGEDICALSVRQRYADKRIAFVPEDRHTTGLVLDYPVTTNFFLRQYQKLPTLWRFFINHARMRATAEDLIARYDIRLHSAEQDARMLSGGNQQKIILAREIEARPRILVIMQATKGLDIGAIEFVQKKILEERDRGTAILYISTELEHVLEVADRIGVMYAGRLSGVLSPEEVTTEKIGLLMAGVTEEAA